MSKKPTPKKRTPRSKCKRRYGTGFALKSKKKMEGVLTRMKNIRKKTGEDTSKSKKITTVKA